MGVEVEERFLGLERDVWEWRIGVEDDRSVPLEERMVIWKGVKKLSKMFVSFIPILVVTGYHAAFASGRMLASSLWNVPYSDPVAKSSFVQETTVNRIDSRILRLIASVFNI